MSYTVTNLRAYQVDIPPFLRLAPGEAVTLPDANDLNYLAPYIQRADVSVVENGSGSNNEGTTAPTAASLIGLRAATAQPTAVSDGQLVRARGDKTGRPVVALHQNRELKFNVQASINNSTAKADLIPASGVAGVFHDVLSITLLNLGTTDTAVHLYDEDDVTVIWSGIAKAGDMRGIVFPTGLKAVNANKKWRWNTATAVSSGLITATVQYSKET